jgi:hypothetical protein
MVAYPERIYTARHSDARKEGRELKRNGSILISRQKCQLMIILLADKIAIYFILDGKRVMRCRSSSHINNSSKPPVNVMMRVCSTAAPAVVCAYFPIIEGTLACLGAIL